MLPELPLLPEIQLFLFAQRPLEHLSMIDARQTYQVDPMYQSPAIKTCTHPHHGMLTEEMGETPESQMREVSTGQERDLETDQEIGLATSRAAIDEQSMPIQETSDHPTEAPEVIETVTEIECAQILLQCGERMLLVKMLKDLRIVYEGLRMVDCQETCLLREAQGRHLTVYHPSILTDSHSSMWRDRNLSTLSEQHLCLVKKALRARIHHDVEEKNRDTEFLLVPNRRGDTPPKRIILNRDEKNDLCAMVLQMPTFLHAVLTKSNLPLQVLAVTDRRIDRVNAFQMIDQHFNLPSLCQDRLIPTMED